MKTRQVLQLDIDVNNPDLPVLDISPEKMAVTSLPGIVCWPSMTTYGLNEARNGFQDNMGIDEQVLSQGTTEDLTPAISVLGVDGGPIYNLAYGDRALIVNPEAIDLSTNSFIIASAALTEFGIGSYNILDGRWFLASNENNLRYEIDGVASGAYSEYDGPALSATAFSTILFIVDRDTNQVYCRVNGTMCLVNTLPSDSVVLNELNFGRLNVGSPQYRQGAYRELIVHQGAITNDVITTIETYLNSLVPA